MFEINVRKISKLTIQIVFHVVDPSPEIRPCLRKIPVRLREIIRFVPRRESDHAINDLFIYLLRIILRKQLRWRRTDLIADIST